MTDDAPKNFVKHPVLGMIPLPGASSPYNFEEKIVKKVLDTFRLNGLKNEVYNRQEELTGYRRLTLDAFHLVVPSFPFYFRAHYVTKMGEKFQLLQCFKGRFPKQLPYKIYQEEKESVPREFKGMPMIVVAKWPYLNFGMAIHRRGDTGGNGFRMVFREDSAKRAGGRETCLEPFTQFLEAIKERWTYDDE